MGQIRCVWRSFGVGVLVGGWVIEFDTNNIFYMLIHTTSMSIDRVSQNSLSLYPKYTKLKKKKDRF